MFVVVFVFLCLVSFVRGLRCVVFSLLPVSGSFFFCRCLVDAGVFFCVGLSALGASPKVVLVFWCYVVCDLFWCVMVVLFFLFLLLSL